MARVDLLHTVCLAGEDSLHHSGVVPLCPVTRVRASCPKAISVTVESHECLSEL